MTRYAQRRLYPEVTGRSRFLPTSMTLSNFNLSVYLTCLTFFVLQNLIVVKCKLAYYVIMGLWVECIDLISPAQDSCLLTNNGNGLPFFHGYSGAAGRPERRIFHQHQAIIPSYRFSCYGNITEWGVDLNPAEIEANFDFELQVWRPSPTVNETGCYSLVDNFIVRSTSIPPLPESEHVARVTPLPQDQLQFQPGDVLGFYVESHGTTTDENNGVVLLNNASYTSELAWHARITALTSQSGSCPYPVGTSGVLNILTRAAPVISISVTTYSCSSPSTCTAPRPSPPPSQPRTPLEPRPPPNNSGPPPFLPQPQPLPSPAYIPSAEFGGQSCISPALMAEILVPLVFFFGVIILIAVSVIIALYFRIRKLHNATVPVSKLEIFRTSGASTKQKFTQNREEYDLPKVDCTQLIQPRQNVAYAIPTGTMERKGTLNNPINHRQVIVKW